MFVNSHFVRRMLWNHIKRVYLWSSHEEVVHSPREGKQNSLITPCSRIVNTHFSPDVNHIPSWCHLDIRAQGYDDNCEEIQTAHYDWRSETQTVALVPDAKGKKEEGHWSSALTPRRWYLCVHGPLIDRFVRQVTAHCENASTTTWLPRHIDK